jgi:hypothetical protein
MPFTDGPALKFELVTGAPANNVAIDIGRTRTARHSRFPALSSCKTFSCKTFSRKTFEAGA